MIYLDLMSKQISNNFCPIVLPLPRSRPGPAPKKWIQNLSNDEKKRSGHFGPLPLFRRLSRQAPKCPR